ncbi:hypothetical protein AYO22_04627 [Fonsecaea multimorphosa]|nr:hypothetical protein AYO22_04627 [Fonsecaea multimorphosa]
MSGADCTGPALWTFRAEDWRRLSFGRHEADGDSNLAVLGHHMDDYRLHLQGPGSWFEQLLPDVCQAQVDSQPTCRLAGYLSILVGLLAFGVKPDDDYKAIIRSFRPDMFSTRFRPHQLQQNPKCYSSAAEPVGHKKRSMVIEIGFDPEWTSADQLSAWERGDYGEMFS